MYFGYKRPAHGIMDCAIRRKILENEKKQSGSTKESLPGSVIDDSSSDNASDRKDDDDGNDLKVSSTYCIALLTPPI